MSQHDVRIDVTELSAEQRRLLEEITGCHLAGVRQLTIEVRGAARQPAHERPSQTVEEWTSILDGWTGDQVDAFDRIVSGRANLTRNVP
ncbi:MAG TPA: hypothetical protein ENJ50_10125 [Planctomycetaceae bacterium]|nr:hypothetical protein [Planctomycetaceae bacterium]